MKIFTTLFLMFFINISFAVEYLDNGVLTKEELKNIKNEFMTFSGASSSVIEKVIATDFKNIALVKLDPTKISPRDPVYITFLVNEKAMIQGDVVVKGEYGLKAFNESLIESENKKYLYQYLALDRNKAQRISVDNIAKEEQTTIYVFTDTSCGYCRKYYSEIPALNAAGVSVKHIPYPRAFNPFSSYEDQAPAFYHIANTLCVDDGSKLLEEYFKKTAINPALSEEVAKSCHDITKAGYYLGQNVGVTGTPGTLFEDGSFVSGYIPADQLLRILRGKKLLK